MDYRKQLKQYVDLKEEIKDLELRIKKLNAKKREAQSDTVVGSNIEFPYNPRVYSITGVNEEAHKEKLDRLNYILIKRKQRCEDLKLEIEEFISTIPDSKTRRVFTLRYIDGLTWLQIARRIERYDESYPRKMIHDKYLDSENK
jgi:DNA-directed RNA polymerase specialized sigma24 family protein